MDENMLKNIKMYLEHETGGQYDDEDALFAEGAQKLKNVLNDSKDRYAEEEYQNLCKEIIQFINMGEVYERKLYNYCLDFYDPSVRGKEKTDNPSAVSVETHSFLTDDELAHLYAFVKSHKNDKTLGMVINQIMFERGLTAPEVYDAAMLRRQDFSRILNSKKGIGKSKIWSVIIGLHCDLNEADIILFSAGYVRKNTVTDLIMEYFIKKKNYDILAINDVLFAYGQKMLSVYTEVRDKDSGAKRKKIDRQNKI